MRSCAAVCGHMHQNIGLAAGTVIWVTYVLQLYASICSPMHFYAAICGSMWPYAAKCNRMRPYAFICVHTRPHVGPDAGRVNWRDLRSCGTLWHPHASICDHMRHMQLYSAICGHMQPYTAMCGHMRRYVAICIHMRTHAAICGHMWPNGGPAAGTVNWGDLWSCGIS